MNHSTKTAPEQALLGQRWLAACLAAASLLTAPVGCAMQQDAPVIPEIEPAGSAPPGEEPVEVDPEGDDAAEAAR